MTRALEVANLLARFGVCSGSSMRQKRAELAARLERETPGLVTEESLMALRDEADLRSIRNRAGWITDQLEDDAKHRQELISELVAQRAAKPIDAGEVNRPARSLAESEARSRGVSLAEIEAETCDARIYYGLVFDCAQPERIARDLGVTIEEVLAAAARHVERHPEYAPWQQAIESGARPSVRFGRARGA